MVEHLDNYRCDRCWHIAASKYLSLKSEADEVIMFYLMFSIYQCTEIYGTHVFVMKFHFSMLGMTILLVTFTGRSYQT